MLLRKSSIFIVSLLMGATALAATPSEKSIDELLAVARVRQQVEFIQKAMVAEFFESKLTNGRNDMSENDRELFAFVHKKVIQIVREEMSWEKMYSIYKQVYSETYTQKEIDDMVVFYKTPSGQALLQKMPLAMQRSMLLTREQILPSLRQRVEQSIPEVAQEYLIMKGLDPEEGIRKTEQLAPSKKAPASNE